MSHPFFGFILSFLFLLSSISVLAKETPNNSYANSIERLSKDSVWLDLLHYHQVGVFSRYESQADDPSFFFSPIGKSNPLAELKASLLSLEQSDYSDSAPLCRFPARTYWLQTKGFLQSKDINQCQKFIAWYQKIDAKSLTLAFPAAYMNSPSSMYGHTFIRINRKNGSNPLLDYSINYAANADPDDNELVFSYKGLSGGYPGVFSVLPYYEKVTEYSHLEARDVWEYDLALSDEEVAQFVRHTWEIQNTYFDYYFFNENCSYHLLTLLDAASDRLHLSDTFKLSAIPADTVRAINEAGLIAETKFRPSTMSMMNHMLSETSSEVQDKAVQLVETDIDPASLLTALNSTEQAQLLDLAYQYSRYLSVRKKQDQKRQAKKAISLLSARSKLDETLVFSDYPTPQYRDDEGHHSKRVELSMGRQEDINFSQFGLRMAYHDRLDNLPGYLKGAKLEMFHMQFRHSETDKKDETRLESLRLIDIASYSPSNQFITPLSWEVSTGLKRPDAFREELVSFLSAGWGITMELAQQHFYALGFFDFQLDDELEKGHHFSSGPKIGWLSQYNWGTFNLEATQPFDISGQEYASKSLTLGIGIPFALNWQLRLSGTYLDFSSPEDKQTHQKDVTLSLMHYF